MTDNVRLMPLSGLSQTQLCGLYELLYGHHPSGAVSASSISDTLDTYCAIRKSDIEYSIDIINTTNRPGLFYEYARFLREKLGDLVRIEHIASDLFTGDLPSAMLSRVDEQLPVVEVSMWERAYTAHTDTGGKRQSEKVRVNRIRLYFEKVEKFMPQTGKAAKALLVQQREAHKDDLAPQEAP